MIETVTGAAFALLQDGEITPDEGIRVINYAIEVLEKLEETAYWIQMFIFLVIIAVIACCCYKFLRIFF